MRREIAGSIVLVTGAGSGIGSATAMRFAREGARVIAADVDLDAATATVSLAAGRDMRALQVDVSDEAAMTKFAEMVCADIGVPDIVVNNAGVGAAGPLMDTTTEDWTRLLGVNLWGVILGCRLFGERMIARGGGGHIVNLASAAAFHPSRILPAYATTKAAVLMYSECLRAELASHGIGVTAVCPGLVNTPIVRSARYVGGDEADAARRREAAVRLYARRNYPPEGVAAAIVSAVRRNRAVVPVTPEAYVLRLVGRFLPGAARVIAARAPLPLSPSRRGPATDT